MRPCLRLIPIVLVLGLAACDGGSDRDRYPVFFKGGSVALTEAGQSIVTYAAEDVRRQHARSVLVIGHAGAGKNLSADELLAMKRASNVASALERSGVNGRIIEQKSRAPRNTRNAAVAARTVTIEIDP